MSRIIGIDLGTTNSCVAFVDHGEPVVIPNPEGSRTTPSVVAFGRDDERLVGSVAKRQSVTQPERTIYAVKRLMGEEFDSPSVERHRGLVPYRVLQNTNGDAWVGVDGVEYSPPEISAMILAQMKATAEAYLGEPVEEAVITVPAYFNDAQRAATKAAGRIAGLEVKRIINEPTAAAIAYGFGAEGSKRIAVYDLGGGTFDVSILEISDGVFQVLSTAGDTHLGGEDIDNALVDELARRFAEEHGLDLRTDRLALQRLKEQAEKAKHELSTSLETVVNLPFIASDASGPKHLDTVLRRSELEILVGDLVDQTLEPCRIALEDARLAVGDIDEVLLVGGQTRMPLVQRKVSEFFGREPSRTVNPDEVVAIGAALQGAALKGQVDELVLLDVTPLTLGVETGGGVFTPLIPRNTSIPTRAIETFTTSIDNQPFVPVHVLQGEREMAGDNKSLARFELAPIPPAPRGVPEIEVAFDIDANGMLTVTAKDLGSGRIQNVRVVASSGLSQYEIDELVNDAQRFKDGDLKRRELAELRNAADALVYTSERAVQDCVDLVPAEVLGEVQASIDALRQVLAAGDTPLIREALTTLEATAYKIAEHLYGET